MHTTWTDRGESRSVTAPLSLVVTAVAPVSDVRRVLTPELWADGDDGAGELLLVDLGRGKNRLGGSALAQVYGQLGAAPPDLDDPALLKEPVRAIQDAVGEQARSPPYHDRSDGGPVRDAGRRWRLRAASGLDIEIGGLGEDPLAVLFAGGAGRRAGGAPADVARAKAVFEQHGLGDAVRAIGHVQRG
jgi:phosphoribosylformylglycinamidine synthase